ncbi:Uncharacterised protein [Klebsiella pneumoniae]|uniref:Uncharacterized protein n=1 Tax=Klebsiella pneumoniae TaxID=573 RepID=A0A377WN94_KLEPN|nr:periplasmic solute binding domain protein [Klebsiella pneumoniae]SQC79896.1 Uncharacterised protein [Klebsiella pneumoniae subsp. pneumoniae]STV56938.1 Uncharacterised protein [Klebsiella pneumoniae subsp. rhinoscleromatis]KHF68601.1 hypothetical protein LV59_02983 [Klebsiella pneumoniae]OKB34935.1 hypothetical protein A9F12_02205 [Klebsiella pneumoniae]
MYTICLFKIFECIMAYDDSTLFLWDRSDSLNNFIFQIRKFCIISTGISLIKITITFILCTKGFCNIFHIYSGIPY